MAIKRTVCVYDSSTVQRHLTDLTGLIVHIQHSRNMSTVNKKKLQIDDVTLAYAEYGEGQPVVFLHGIGSSSHSWRHVAQVLSSSYRTFCFDLMGFGDSDKPRNKSYSINYQAGLIRKALSQLGLERIVLVGHSMGGGVCLSMMRELGDEQDLVAKLVLVDAMSYPQIPPWFVAGLWIPILPTLLGRLIPKRLAFHLMESTIYYNSARVSPEIKTGYIRNAQSPGAYPALVRAARQMIPLDMIDLMKSYKRISVPSLIIWGRDDRVIPVANGRRLARDIPDARLHEIENCGHCPQEEYPEETALFIRRFIEDIADH